MKSYYIYTYGCQMNTADSERLSHQLESVGYTPTEDVETADLILLNTCAVRENAETKVYGRIGELMRLKRKNKNLILAVTGCMAQKNQAEMFKRAPHIDIVLGTHNIQHINEMIEEVQRGHTHQISVDMDNTVLPELEAKPNGTFYAWVPIMNGCNKFCTYCIVPHVRGREISRPVEAIVKEVTDLGAKGFKEITLLGQNVNSYGLDFKDGTDFGTLIDALDGIPGIERIRYMTSHPQDMTKSMIDALGRSSNIVTHLHLPIQSGSDRILKKMNRHYTVEHYKELLSYCREKIKNVGNFIFIKILIKFWMSAYNLTFTWLNDQAINIFCKNIFKTCCLSSSAIFCCLKNNAVSIFGKDTVDPLDQSREYIIRNIGCNHCNVL